MKPWCEMSDDLVTVAGFLTIQEAKMARGFLESNGFLVFLGDEAMVPLSPIVGSIKLRVREQDAETVRKLLADIEADSGTV
jgi:hypothetical protein